jgi:ABC-type phosphate transport system substrate-binding protein
MAEALPGKCKGTEVLGQGSSLQKIAQEVWTGVLGGKGFNVNTEGCTAVGAPKVKYTSSGSGTGLKEWGAECGVGKPSTSKDVYIGTDEPPTPGVGGQLECIDLAAGATAGQAVVVPVLQASVAVIAHPPLGCDVFGLANADLQSLWAGKTVLLWDDLPEKVGTFLVWNELVAGACLNPITRVVRKDKSGTTFVFKSYLDEISLTALCNGKTWTELSTETENLVWPTSSAGGCPAGLSPLLVSANNGGSGEVEEVKNTEGSIGYANLGDARKAGEDYTWLSIENGKTAKFEYPGEATEEPNSAEISNANCKEAEYTNLPSEANAEKPDADWSKVSGAHPAKNAKYPICTLSYDIGLVNYELAGFAKPGGEAQTANDYLHYLVAPLGGQSDFAKRDYRKVEEAVEKRAEKAAALVGVEP